jgi:hypothetical protein
MTSLLLYWNDDDDLGESSPNSFISEIFVLAIVQPDMRNGQKLCSSTRHCDFIGICKRI